MNTRNKTWSSQSRSNLLFENNVQESSISRLSGWVEHTRCRLQPSAGNQIDHIVQPHQPQTPPFVFPRDNDLRPTVLWMGVVDATRSPKAARTWKMCWDVPRSCSRPECALFMFGLVLGCIWVMN